MSVALLAEATGPVVCTGRRLFCVDERMREA